MEDNLTFKKNWKMTLFLGKLKTTSIYQTNRKNPQCLAPASPELGTAQTPSFLFGAAMIPTQHIKLGLVKVTVCQIVLFAPSHKGLFINYLIRWEGAGSRKNNGNGMGGSNF